MIWRVTLKSFIWIAKYFGLRIRYDLSLLILCKTECHRNLWGINMKWMNKQNFNVPITKAILAINLFCFPNNCEFLFVNKIILVVIIRFQLRCMKKLKNITQTYSLFCAIKLVYEETKPILKFIGKGFFLTLTWHNIPW